RARRYRHCMGQHRQATTLALMKALFERKPPPQKTPSEAQSWIERYQYIVSDSSTNTACTYCANHISKVLMLNNTLACPTKSCAVIHFCAAGGREPGTTERVRSSIRKYIFAWEFSGSSVITCFQCSSAPLVSPSAKRMTPS